MPPGEGCSSNSKLGSQPSPRTPVPPPDDRVHERIGEHDQTCQQKLHRVRKRHRVDGWREIVLDETAREARDACRATKRVLDGCEWADAPRHLDEHPPEGGWKVHKRRPTPAQSEEPAGHHEDDEREMEDEDQIGQGVIDHDARLLGVGSSVRLASQRTCGCSAPNSADHRRRGTAPAAKRYHGSMGPRCASAAAAPWLSGAPRA